MTSPTTTTWRPESIYANGSFQSGVSLEVNTTGKIVRLSGDVSGKPENRLNRRALLPGLVNAHSHAFQRLIRGRTEYRTRNSKDSFWTWREMMYNAAARLDPDDIYDASRMAFLEMALGGITAVGEFHYLHHAPDGTAYEDPNLLAKQVVRAARDVGLRIALLRVAYARSGFETEPNPQQIRFIEARPEQYLENVDTLKTDLESDEMAWAGIAPHSVRAVPLDYLREIIGFGNEHSLPIHMHVAEQPAEVSACIAENGRSPVALLDTEGLLSERFTAVHAIHITDKAVRALAGAGAIVCACPTTERNLGDGVIPADKLFQSGIRVSLGTDSHTQIDLFEDARELEYHLRLQKMERVVLAGPAQEGQSLASRLFDCASKLGGESISAPVAQLTAGQAADFFTVDLEDPSIAGASSNDLLPAIVFSLSRTAVRDVVVGGKQIIQDGRHHDQEEIVERFEKLQRRLWN